MFEVTFIKKPAVKVTKTSLLWQQPAFSLTSNDLNIILCDSKAVKSVKWSFLLQLRPYFWSSTPNDKTRNTCTYSMCQCVAEVDWLIPGHSIRIVLAHFSGWHSRTIQGYFIDEIIIFKYDCASNSLRFGKLVTEKQLNEYISYCLMQGIVIWTTKMWKAGSFSSI